VSLPAITDQYLRASGSAANPLDITAAAAAAAASAKEHLVRTRVGSASVVVLRLVVTPPRYIHDDRCHANSHMPIFVANRSHD